MRTPSRPTLALASRPSAVPLLLAAVAYVLALLQRPGDRIADGPLALHLDPGGVLGDATAVWDSSDGLGALASAASAGLAVPVAPFFALGDALGLPEWLVNRLWVGTLLAVAAWGAVRLVDALVVPRRGVVHLAAGAAYAFSPAVVVGLNRTSLVLLAHAALPWLLAFAHRGLREPIRWRWPFGFAIAVALAGGAIHPGALAWVLVGVAVFVGCELVVGGVGLAALAAWALRVAVVGVVAWAWWLVPLAIEAGGQVDRRTFAEPAASLWATASASEALRGLGVWTTYDGVGFGGVLRPFATHGPAYLFSLPVVLATLALPAAALASWLVAARHRAAPFFLVLVLVGVLVVAAGFPEGSPLRDVLDAVAGDDGPLVGLRSTTGALPLVALGLAGLAGLGAGHVRDAMDRRGVAPGLRAVVAAVAVGVLALAAWPLTSGRAPDRQVAFAVPDHWERAAEVLDAAGDDSRVLVLPGRVTEAARWGLTTDPVLPALVDRPVTTRAGAGTGDPRSTELLAAVDALVSQERLLPGQLAPLLEVLGVGDVVIARDGDRSRSGELGAAEVDRTIGEQPVAGLADPVGLGPARRIAPAAGRLASPVDRPSLEIRSATTSGLVRVLPRGPLTVADGGARALTGLAAFSDLPGDRPFAYAPDLDRQDLAEAIRGGAAFVVADGVRRQAFVPGRLRSTDGPVLAADVDPGASDAVRLDPFAVPAGDDIDPPGSDAQTIAVLRGRGGVRSVTAPSDPRTAAFPEHRPTAAIDGDRRTMWLADPALDRSEHHLDITFDEPRDVPRLALVPANDARATVRAVEVNGRRHAVGPGRTVLRTALKDVRRVRIALTEVDGPARATPGAGGLREIEIPGVRVREVLRAPVLLEDALRGEDLALSPITYLFSRVTADAPSLRGRLRGEPQARDPRDAVDPEPRLARLMHPPERRRADAEAWVSVDPRASDRTLDRLVDPAAARLGARSSSRFENRPRHRASGAFDGGTARSWIGQWIPGRPAWISWTTPTATTVERLRLVPPAARVRVPTRVRLTAGGDTSLVAAVRSDGFVRLPRAVRGTSFRLDVVDAAFRPGTPGAALRRRAVGIGEIRGAGVDPVPARRTGRIEAPCGTAELRLAGRTTGLRIDPQALERFDAGLPLRATGCAPVRLGDERAELVDTGRGPLRIDHLRIAAAPTGGVAVAGLGGRVVEPGSLDGGERSGVRVEVEGPAWLVHGEAYDRGWRASCDGRDLGDPLPLLGAATAWRIERGCESVEITHAAAPLRRAGVVVSAAGTALLLLLLLVLARRRRAEATLAGDAVALRAVPAHLRPAPVADPPGLGGRARGTRTLRGALAAAGVLLLAVGVPAAHLAVGFDDPGGFDPRYAADREVAHWLAVGGLMLLAGSLVGVVRRTRRPRG